MGRLTSWIRRTLAGAAFFACSYFGPEDFKTIDHINLVSFYYDAHEAIVDGVFHDERDDFLEDLIGMRIHGGSDEDIKGLEEYFTSDDMQSTRLFELIEEYKLDKILIVPRFWRGTVGYVAQIKYHDEIRFFSGDIGKHGYESHELCHAHINFTREELPEEHSLWITRMDEAADHNRVFKYQAQAVVAVAHCTDSELVKTDENCGYLAIYAGKNMEENYCENVRAINHSPEEYSNLKSHFEDHRKIIHIVYDMGDTTKERRDKALWELEKGERKATGPIHSEPGHWKGGPI